MSESGTTALSPDGRYRWDGYGWLPVVPALPDISVQAATTVPTAFGIAPARAHRRVGRRSGTVPKILAAVIAVVIAVALGAVVVVARSERKSCECRVGERTAITHLDPSTTQRRPNATDGSG